MNSNAQSMNDRLYEDFQPAARWVTEESKTLEIHLPEFRKEHIRVQLDNQGNLKISGERPLEENKWSRFLLRLRIPNDYNFNEIHAKFINNVLRIILPKKIVPTRLEVLPSQEINANDQRKREEQIPSGAQADMKKNPSNESEHGSPGNYQVGIGGYVVTLRQPRRVLIVNVAVAIAMVVAAGAYVVYRLRDGGKLMRH